jgi:hypothetical protein
MMGSLITTDRTKNTSDVIIDGLFGGLAAGAVMAIMLGLTSFLINLAPVELFGRFSTGEIRAPITGLLLHLAVSSIYGAIFSLFAHWLPKALRRRLPAWLAGLIYATVLLFVALGVLIPGLQSPLSELPIWMLALAHAGYGLALGKALKVFR